MKKKLLSIVLSAFITLNICAVNMPIFAEDEISEYLIWEEYDSDADRIIDSVKITDCKPLIQSVVIPSEINGMPVKEISEKAFYGCYYLESVVVPENVEKIGDNAFNYCYNLQNVTMPDIEAGTDAFANTAYQTNLQFQNESFDITAFKNGEAVKLPERMHPENASEQYQQIYNQANNGIYFVDNKNAVFLSLEDGTIKNTFIRLGSIDILNLFTEKYGMSSDTYGTDWIYNGFDNIYCDGNVIYIAGAFKYRDYEAEIYRYKMAVSQYNMDTMKFENTVFLEDFQEGYITDAVIGVDSQKRIYALVFDYENTNNVLRLFSPEGKLLDSYDQGAYIDEFMGFDKTNGNFYYTGLGGSVYQRQSFLMAGNVSDDKFSPVEQRLCGIEPMYYTNRRKKYIELIDDKYLCIDAHYMFSSILGNTVGSGFFMFDSNNFDVNNPSEVQLHQISKEFPTIVYEDDRKTIDEYGTNGARVNSNKGNLIINDELNRLTEIDSTGKSIVSRNVSHNIYSVLGSDENVYLCEKDEEGNYYLEKIQWTYDDAVTVDKQSVELDIGLSATVTAMDNLLKNYYSWSSENPDIASVNQSGEIFAYSVGETIVSVKNAYGLVADIIVKVNDPDIVSGNISSLNGEESDNSDENDYSVWAKPIYSYLNENDDDSFTRFEYVEEWNEEQENYEGRIILEDYADDKLISSKTIQPELDIFGGAFFGEKYNFVVYGQLNLDKDDTVEVMRIVKYSKDWTRLESHSLYGEDTYIPFRAGTLRMTEYNGILYIHTCHEMYSEHQENMSIVVKQENIEAEGAVTVANFARTSHSLNQFVHTDGEYIYTVDHGDAGPRGIKVSRLHTDDAHIENVFDQFYIVPFSFTSKFEELYGIHYNFTGASIGGFEIGAYNCLIAFDTLDQETASLNQRNIKITVVDKLMKNSEIIDITNYPDDADIYVGTPQLVKINNNAFMLMWKEIKNDVESVSMVTVDENGKMLTEIKKSYMLDISDCQPIYCSDGLVRWYVTDNDSPVIYAVNPFKLDILFSDGNGLKGDANLDSKVNVRDCAFIASSLANDLAGELPENADYNSDNKINVRDAAAIAFALANGEL